jgi:uncharacterized protein (TIGR02598 family)
MAIGIIAFIVIVLIGLLSIGVAANKSSRENMAITLMSQQVENGLRQQPFTNLPNITAVSTSTTTLQTIFFDANGTRLQNTSTTPPQDLVLSAALAKGAIYQCQVTAQADTQTPGLSLNASSLPALVDVTLTFTWPVQAASPPNKAIIHASLADYF